LGLFIVKGLVEAMDGEIRLYCTQENEMQESKEKKNKKGKFIAEIKLALYKPEEHSSEG
jgi:hypothetical protein